MDARLGDDKATYNELAYLYTRISNTWFLFTKLVPEDEENKRFGNSIAVNINNFKPY